MPLYLMFRQLSFDQTLVPPASESERMMRMQRYERALYQQGIEYIAGVDEAGRGCLAGPVVAAAVILPREWSVSGINDSKQLTPAQRETLFVLIQQQAVSWGVGISSETAIDAVNILQATYLAMEQALSALTVTPQYILLDAVTLKNITIPQRGIIKGDALSVSIAAASIVAKVTRDHIMLAYDKQYPDYGFANHKGYGTTQHLYAIATYGPCPIHRKTFRGVKEYFNSHTTL